MPLQILRKSVPASREAITGLAEMLKCGCTEPELVKDALMSAEHPRFPEIMLELLQSENPQVRAIAEEVASVRLNTLWFLRRAAPLCPYMRKYVTGKLIGGNGVQRLFAAKILLDSGDVSSIRVLESAVEMEGARGGLDSAVCMGAALDLLKRRAARREIPLDTGPDGKELGGRMSRRARRSMELIGRLGAYKRGSRKARA